MIHLGITSTFTMYLRQLSYLFGLFEFNSMVMITRADGYQGSIIFAVHDNAYSVSFLLN